MKREDKRVLDGLEKRLEKAHAAHQKLSREFDALFDEFYDLHDNVRLCKVCKEVPHHYRPNLRRGWSITHCPGCGTARSVQR